MKTLTFLIVLFLATAAIHAENWPQFRGPTGQGHSTETGLPLHWSATSNVVWKTSIPGQGLVFTAGGWGGQESIKAFRLGGTGDLEETNLVWQQTKGMPKVPSMVYVKPHLYAVSDAGVAACMDSATGNIVWQERLGGNFSASPVFAEGRLYFLSDGGETTVIAAGPEFKVLAKNPLNEKVQASMAVSQRQLFFRTENHLYCIGAK